MDIEITLKNYRCFQDTKPARFLIKKGIISFLGVNNSGKSSLLKFFYEFRPLLQTLSSPSGNLKNALHGKQQTQGYGNTIKDYNEVFCNVNDRDLVIEIVFRDNISPINGIPVAKKLVIAISRKDHCWSVKLYTPDGELATQGQSLDYTSNILRINNALKCDLSSLFEAFKKLANNVYIGPFRNAINVGTKDNYFDIQVGQSFIQSWRNYKTGNSKQQNEAIFKLTDSIKRIFEFENLEINPSDQDTDFQLFVNGKSYKLSELGSGLAQFVLVLANAAIREPDFILIDEPELNLHPTLQLDFLTSLASYAKEGVLFATHSIGLARISADIKYSVLKNIPEEREIVDLETMPRLSEFLGELSFSGYQELGFDKILLVEGPTDVKTYQQFLRKLNKDHKILIMPLGGSSMINAACEDQLQELTRISRNIFATIDSERKTKGDSLDADRSAFEAVCKKVGITCHALADRATENYLSERAIKIIKGSKYIALKPYEKLNNLALGWSKSENWRIAREMKNNEFEKTDLGKFLSKI